jgi:hypothetical protein
MGVGHSTEGGIVSSRIFAIRFDFPEGEKLYAGMHKGAFGWAPTLATALIYEDEETARRVLVNGYGKLAQDYGRVVVVKDGGAP